MTLYDTGTKYGLRVRDGLQTNINKMQQYVKRSDNSESALLWLSELCSGSYQSFGKRELYCGCK